MDETTNPIPEVEEQALPETDDLHEESAEEQPVIDDSEEVEYEGEKYRVPKPLKDALLRQADYTRKTQMLAEERKAAQAERANYAQANQEYLQGLARVVALDDQLGQYEKVDWAAVTQADPVQAQQAWIQYQQLKDHRQALAVQLQQREQQRQFEAKQMAATQLEEGRRVLERDIKGWSPELAKQIADCAVKEYGYPPEELAGATHPRHVMVLHDAMQWRQFQAKQKAEQKVTQAKPVSTVGGTSAKTSKDPSEMSDAEFNTWRRRQIAQRK